MIAVGKRAPAFKLPDQDDDIVSLADYKGLIAIRRSRRSASSGRLSSQTRPERWPTTGAAKSAGHADTVREKLAEFANRGAAD
jgi:hypothetical protein